MNRITSTAIVAGPSYNEADVRFHIIDPLIRALGYGEEEGTYLVLEGHLSYPYQIGRRSKKDFPLGKADYRAGLKGARGSFIVEAKAGNVPLGQLEIDQAHSYAAHAHVGANYFVLGNGLEIRIYETLSGHGAEPIVMIKLSEINERFYEIENILSPANLAKHCKVKYDRKLKLCSGLGSSATFRSGIYNLEQYGYRILINGEDQTQVLRANVPQIAKMDEQLEWLRSIFELRVEDGEVTRAEDGRITAFARMNGATRPNKEAMRVMGIDEISFTTSEQLLSTEPKNPTMFEGTKDFGLAKGASLPLLMGGSESIIGDVEGYLIIRIVMHFDGKDIIGRYRSHSYFNVEIAHQSILKMEMEFHGSFSLQPDL